MIAALIRVLEVIFALGLLGSSVVLLLTLIEDAKMLFEKDEKLPRVAEQGPAAAHAVVMQ
jgi:hypothetical protein